MEYTRQPEQPEPSADEQRHAIAAHAATHGFHVAEQRNEDEERPGLRRALEDVGEGDELISDSISPRTEDR